MRRAAFLTVLKLVVALPDRSLILACAVPDLGAEETATAGAYQFC